jgi:hypothetical protein
MSSVATAAHDRSRQVEGCSPIVHVPGVCVCVAQEFRSHCAPDDPADMPLTKLTCAELRTQLKVRAAARRCLGQGGPRVMAAVLDCGQQHAGVAGGSDL